MHWAQLRWVQLCCLTNLLFFDIPLLYFFTNLNSSIIWCFFSGDMYPFFGDFISSFCNSLGYLFETLIILSAILLSIKSPVASAVFWIAYFEAVFIPSAANFLALSRSFWLYLLLKLLPMFLVKDKNSYSFTYILSLGSFEYLIFIKDASFSY